MTGTWAYWLGCSGQEHFIAFSATDNAQAHTDYVTYHTGVGSGAYWFMGGPGVDPNYNGTTAEASTWGARQAARALSDIASGAFDYKVVWMDVELPGITPARDNGWNSVYTSPCSGVVKQSYVPTSLDRADFDGFWNYITAHSAYKVGVYSSAGSGRRFSAPAATRRSRTPTSGPMSRRPRTTPAPTRTAGAWITAPGRARSSSAVRPAPARTR